MKKEKQSFQKHLIEEGKKTGKKPTKFALKFAKVVDDFYEAQRITGVSLADVYKEMRR